MYLELLQQLSVHSQWSRRAGHSAAMLQGAIATDSMILVVDAAHARGLSDLATELTDGRIVMNRSRFITVADARERLMGQTKPVLIDHHTLEFIVAGALRQMRDMVSRDRMAAAAETPQEPT